jgi:hypothetical protein
MLPLMVSASQNMTVACNYVSDYTVLNTDHIHSSYSPGHEVKPINDLFRSHIIHKMTNYMLCLSNMYIYHKLQFLKTVITLQNSVWKTFLTHHSITANIQ